MISGTEPANAAVVACDTPATTRPHAARVGAWALADWLIPLALALVTFAVFSPALSNNFVDWDDQINLTGNEEYRGLGTAQLKYFFTTVLMGHYIPLTWLTFGLDYVQWGMNPTGYHLTRSEEHTSELQSPCNLVCRLLLEKKKPPPSHTTACR